MRFSFRMSSARSSRRLRGRWRSEASRPTSTTRAPIYARLRSAPPDHDCCARRDILGFFTDSELAWFANPVPNSTFILGEYLLLPPSAAGRIAAQQWLEKKYGGSVASLEASWNLTGSD